MKKLLPVSDGPRQHANAREYSWIECIGPLFVRVLSGRQRQLDVGQRVLQVALNVRTHSNGEQADADESLVPDTLSKTQNDASKTSSCRR